MNKESIERTKSRCARLIRRVEKSPVVYYTIGARYPDPRIWEPLTQKQYLFVGLVLLSIVTLVIWWAK